MDDGSDTPGWGDESTPNFRRNALAAEATPFDDPTLRRLLAASQLPPPGVGEQVGPFELVESIGSGGFGEVFRGMQREPVKREAAVKVLMGFEQSAGVVSRFERERQVLVRLRHPGIVRLLEAGVTPSGLPWFAMDLVAGRTIDRWADEANPDLRTRLRVLRDLADAVAAAHRQGVLHRDLKPSNILIQEGDSGPRVQVVDFGIAKVLDEGGDGSAATRAGHVIGTPEYMSPEAASLEADRVDTRSDVYALGLVAFRVLAGRPAIEAAKGTSLAQRLQLAAAPQIPRLSAACRDASLARRVRGEVEWVVARAIATDPAARYPSAGELKEEFERLLAGEPVAAAPPSGFYQLRAFTRRHKAIVASGAFSFLALAAAALLSGSFALAESRERSRAEEALASEARERVRAEEALAEEAKRRSELERVAAFQEASLAAIDVGRLGVELRDSVREEILEQEPETQAAIESALAALDFTDLARKAIDAGLLAAMPATIIAEFEEQPAVAARLLLAVAVSCISLGLYESAFTAAGLARELFESVHGREHATVIDAAVKRYSAMRLLGRAGEAAAEIEEWWAIAQRVLPPGDRLRNECGRAFASSLATTTEGYSKRLEIFEMLDLEDEEAGFPRDLRTADVRAEALERLGRLEEAFNLRQQVATAIETDQLVGPNASLRRDPNRFMLRLSFVNSLFDRGRLQEAIAACESLLREMATELGSDHPDTLVVRGDHALLLGNAGMLDQALAIEIEIVSKRRALLGQQHPSTLQAIQNLALRHRRLGDLPASEQLFREAMQGAAAVLPPENPLRLTIEVNFGGLLQTAGRGEEALAVLESVYPRLVGTHGVDHPRTVSTRRNIGVVLNDLGRHEEALPIFEEGLAATEATSGPDALTTIVAMANLGGLYRAIGRHEDSLATLDEAIARAGRTLPPTHWNIGVFLTYRGRTLLAMERFEEATASLSEANALLEAALGPRHTRAVEARRRLAEAFEAWHLADPQGGHDAEAERWNATLPAGN